MRFSFTDDQLALRAAVRQVLESECTTAALRQMASVDVAGIGLESSDVDDQAPSNSRSRWDVLAELGAVGLLAPESCGGLGLSEVELVGVLEEAGWAALPEPFAESAALAMPLLAGSPLVAAVARGESVATVGGIDVTAELPGNQPGTVDPLAAARGDGRQLRTERVVGANVADLFVLFAPTVIGWEVHLVVRADVDVEATPSIDPTRDIGTVVWAPSPATLLAEGDDAASLAAATVDRAAVAMAAQLLGLSDRMITLTADYAKARTQFGKPIGSFQAVKHLLADARVRLEFARPVTYRAAYSLAQNAATRSHDASMAKVMASDAADLAARVALQVHGAIGYTWECDLHFFMKRAWALSTSWGDAGTHRARVLAAALAARADGGH